MGRPQVGTAENPDVNAVRDGPRAFLAYHLALAGRQSGKKVVEVPETLVLPMKLLAGAKQQASLTHLPPFDLGGVGDMQR